MAKKKGKKGKGKKKAEQEDPNILKEVDKTFYELQIADLNRKLARLRETNIELETQNVALEQNIAKLDEDRSDVIAYLKRTLQEKQNEASELQERLVAMQESKESDVVEHEKQVADMEVEYNTMREQLTSEIKLITGKLNALEEFRVQRENLMKRYEEQEKRIEEQEIRHREEIYNAEKKYIFGKDMVKKEMERRLLQLASDFQDANRIQMAATTHRMIRENISLNNDMDAIVNLCSQYHAEIEKLRDKDRNHSIQTEIVQDERDGLLKNNKVQQEVISQLRTKYHKLMDELTETNKIVQIAKVSEKQLEECLKREENLSYKVRILEQNLHATKCHEYSVRDALEHANTQTKKLREVMYEAIYSIKSAMKLQDNKSMEQAEKISTRKNLLRNMLTLLQEGIRAEHASVSLETVGSVSTVYAKGDLGFVPKFYTEPPPVLKLNMETQTGQSFEEFLKKKPKDETEEAADTQAQIDYVPSIVYVTQSMDDFYRSSESELEVMDEAYGMDYSYLEGMESMQGEMGEEQSMGHVPSENRSSNTSDTTDADNVSSSKASAIN